MELKRVLIQGEPYPVHFGVYGLTRIMKKYDITYGELIARLNTVSDVQNMKAQDFDFLYDVIHTGFASGALFEGNEFKYSAEQLMLFLPMDDEGMADIFGAISEASPQDDGQKKAKKKTSSKAKK